MISYSNESVSRNQMYFYFDSKIEETEGKKFFIKYEQFYKAFYICVFKAYLTENQDFNHHLIQYSSFFFYCIKRKIERFQCRCPVENINEIDRDYDNNII